MPVKSDTVLPTARDRCDISSKGAVLPWRNDAEMGPANSLHTSAYYSEYNKRFDFNSNDHVRIFGQCATSADVNKVLQSNNIKQL